MFSSKRLGNSVLAGALALSGVFFNTDAHALALGRISVQSAIGEPLKAEIDVLEISADEAASLKFNVGSPEAFRAAGLEYNPATANLQFSLQRRKNGRPFLRVSSSRPVAEPFVDLVLEARWSSGRVVRDYTMLFDPPSLKVGASIPATNAPVLNTPAVSPAQPTPQATPPASKPATVAAAPAPELWRPKTEVKSTELPPSPSAAAEPKPKSATPSPEKSKVAVKRGDTAGKIAAANKPVGVSLDQMLVALLQANPDAFLGKNVNRIKAGAVLNLPSQEELNAVEPEQASRTIIAQSKSFNEFRRKLAEAALDANVNTTGRKAEGKVQAKVEDKAPAPTSADKLTLSKGAIQAPAVAGKASAAAVEDKIARERQAKETAARLDELSKNINALNALSSSTKTTTATSVAPSTTSKTTPTTAPLTPTVTAVKATPAASAAPAAVPTASSNKPTEPAATTIAPATPEPAAATKTTTPTPLPPVSAPVATSSSPVPAPVVLAKTPSESGFTRTLTDNLFILLGAGGLMVLLAGFAVYRSRQTKIPAQVDSSFLESRLQPDSFFGASGGQKIDTAENNVPSNASALVYNSNQLDASGDVDPVAEADVYLAYGRDLQAEEILKEAMQINPKRIAIHAKLAEIYAKRRDVKAFEALADDVLKLTNGDGIEWIHICELGQVLVPGSAKFELKSSKLPVDESVLNSEPVNAFAESKRAAPVVATSTPAAPSPIATAQSPSTAVDIDLGMHDAPVFPPAAAPATAAAISKAPAPMQTAVMPFDLNSVSLELEKPAATTPAAPREPADPLATKLALAHEFRDIGDMEGARALTQEVIAQASGPLKGQAQNLLATLT